MSVKLKITETCLCKDKKININLNVNRTCVDIYEIKILPLCFIMKFILNCEHEDTFDNGHL